MGHKIGNNELSDQKFGVYFVEHNKQSLVCYFDDEQEALDYASGLANTRLDRTDISEAEKSRVGYTVSQIIGRLGISDSGIYTGIDWQLVDDDAEQTA